MKIYKRDEFLKLPSGTLFFQCDLPGSWGNQDLMVKYDTLECNDWVERSLTHIECNDMGDMDAKLDAMLHEGASVAMSQYGGRNGCFDDKDLFCVFELADLLQLRDIVNEAVSVAKT